MSDSSNIAKSSRPAVHRRSDRIGAGVFTLPQLKVIQEVLSLVVFALFYALYWKEKLSWNFMAAGFCLVGAVFFMFRDLKPL